MSKFWALMDCHFGSDGLESTHPLRTSEKLEEMFEQQLLLWNDVPYTIIFQVSGLEYPASNKLVMVERSPEMNYPHWAVPEGDEVPAWFHRALRSHEALAAEQARIKAKAA